MENKNNNTLALVLSIVGLILGTLGAILFGIFCAIPGLICGIVGMLLGSDMKKKTQNQVGGAAFVVGLLALIFSAIFTVGCGACGSQCGGYGCKGIVGGSCSAVNDANDYSDDINDAVNDALKDLQDSLN